MLIFMKRYSNFTILSSFQSFSAPVRDTDAGSNENKKPLQHDRLKPAVSEEVKQKKKLAVSEELKQKKKKNKGGRY